MTFDAAYATSSWGAFDAQWAGGSWDDFDAAWTGQDWGTPDYVTRDDLNLALAVVLHGTARMEALLALQQIAATIEDLCVSALLVPDGVVASSGVSCPVLVAPFPMTVTGVSVVVWGGTGVPASPSAYWLAEVRVQRASGSVLVAERSTAVQGIEARRGWAVPVPADLPGAELAAGDVLAVALHPEGPVPALSGPVLATVRYRPR